MKSVVLLLHFYQPPTQDPAVVRRIDRECYNPVFRLLRELRLPVTVNINYSLTRQLASLCGDTLDILGDVAGCEFTQSGAFHPIFPLIPGDEVLRQLEVNAEGNRRLLPAFGNPSGVFPPEMALDGGTAALLARAGYRWTVTDDVPWVSAGKEVPGDWVPEYRGIRVLLRSNFWSNLISFHGDDGRMIASRMVKEMREWMGDDDSYLVVAMDGETFGHHRPGGLEGFLKPFLETIRDTGEARIAPAGEIALGFPGRAEEVPDGSWSTSSADLERGVPFPLWDDPDNPDHAALRLLLNTVLKRARDCPSATVAGLADEMLYSCPFWWASPGRYSPIQVRRGVCAVLETALAVSRECPDRVFMDTVMALAGGIPAMARKDD